MDKLHKKILSKSKFIEFKKHTILLREDELSNTLVYLKKGVVRHYFLDINGNEITKNFITGPAFFVFSLSSFISQTRSFIQCETLTKVELYEMTPNNFSEMLKEREFLKFWNGLLSDFIIKKEKKELSFMKDSAFRRYEIFLKDFPGLLNEIPHYYIASYLSISPETLSRIRKRNLDLHQ